MLGRPDTVAQDIAGMGCRERAGILMGRSSVMGWRAVTALLVAALPRCSTCYCQVHGPYSGMDPVTSSGALDIAKAVNSCRGSVPLALMRQLLPAACPTSVATACLDIALRCVNSISQ